MGEHRLEALAEQTVRVDQTGQAHALQAGGFESLRRISETRARDQGVVVAERGADRPGEAAEGPVETEEAGRAPAIAPDRHPGVGADLADQGGEGRAQQRAAELRRLGLQRRPGASLARSQLRRMHQLDFAHRPAPNLAIAAPF